MRSSLVNKAGGFLKNNNSLMAKPEKPEIE
jgi:hypothetical protein